MQAIYIVHVFQNILQIKERKKGLKKGHISAMKSSENPIFMNPLYTITPNNKNQLTLVPRWWQQTDK